MQTNGHGVDYFLYIGRVLKVCEKEFSPSGYYFIHDDDFSMYISACAILWKCTQWMKARKKKFQEKNFSEKCLKVRRGIFLEVSLFKSFFLLITNTEIFSIIRLTSGRENGKIAECVILVFMNWPYLNISCISMTFLYSWQKRRFRDFLSCWEEFFSAILPSSKLQAEQKRGTI